MITNFQEAPVEFWEDLKSVLQKHFGKRPNGEAFECLIRSICIYIIMCTKPPKYREMGTLFIEKFDYEMTQAVNGAILLEKFGKQ